MLETVTEERPERLAAATACGANEGLELREAELDGIEVRAIGCKYQRVAPAAWRARWMPATLWAPRLSAMTMSPGCRVGTRIWSM